MIPCFLLFLTAVVVDVATGHQLLWALLLGLALFYGLGRKHGYSGKALAAMAWKRGKTAWIVIPVLLLIGMVTALWRASGTVSFFLYYGLKGIAPKQFLLVAFLLSALLSLALGTAFGVTGTAGVVLVTLARFGGVSVAMTAGAVLSGAYFGDRCSPMSSCATLVAACTGTELYHNVRKMLRTAVLPTALTVAFYAVLSAHNPIATVDSGMLSALSDSNSLWWPVLLPAALMLVLPLAKVPVKWAMAASSLTAFALAVILQQLPLADTLRTAIFGYVPATPELSQILSGGGIVSMLPSSAVVLITSLYSGILEGIGALLPAKVWIEQMAKKLGLFPTTAMVSTLIVMMFCNQSVMVIMDEQLLSDTYRKHDAAPIELAMDIANSGVTIAGLVPWSIALTIPLTMLDAQLSAVPFAALLYLIPLWYLFTRKRFVPSFRQEAWAD